MNTPTQENIAQTLARELPVAHIVHTQTPTSGGAVTHIAVPKGFDLKTLDDEKLQAGPRRAAGTAAMSDAASFLAYVERHKQASTAVWCDFNPATFALSFLAVMDEHGPGVPGWRGHGVKYTPRSSVEWGTWVKGDGKDQSQLEFASFIEANEKDIAAAPGLPSSLDMMKMATAFEANAEKTLKSKVRLQSGGVELAYVNMDDDQTVEKMRLFEKFQIGIPVFWELRKADESIPAWPIVARLKYRVSQGAVTFWYDLIRPDVVHERAALAMIDKIRAGLGDVPMHMGAFN